LGFKRTGADGLSGSQVRGPEATLHSPPDATNQDPGGSLGQKSKYSPTYELNFTRLLSNRHVAYNI